LTTVERKTSPGLGGKLRHGDRPDTEIQGTTMAAGSDIEKGDRELNIDWGSGGERTEAFQGGEGKTQKGSSGIPQKTVA